MKKAKMMLSAIAIVGVVSATFAFKSNKYIVHSIFTGPLTGSTFCTVPVQGEAISNGTPTVRASLTSLSSNCPQVFTTLVDND